MGEISGWAALGHGVIVESKRMKAARLVVLVVAVAAGGAAALLAGRGGDEPPPSAPAATGSIDTVDVLVAKTDIPLGQWMGAQDMQWQLWPTQAASPVFMRKSDKPNAIEELTGAIGRARFGAGGRAGRW